MNRYETLRARIKDAAATVASAANAERDLALELVDEIEHREKMDAAKDASLMRFLGDLKKAMDSLDARTLTLEINDRQFLERNKLPEITEQAVSEGIAEAVEERAA